MLRITPDVFVVYFASTFVPNYKFETKWHQDY